MSETEIDRRAATARLAAAGLAALMLPATGVAQSPDLPLTPACGAPAAPTRRQTEGPYFLASAPAKADLRGDGPGETVVLSGFVLTPRCRPVSGTVIDLWHADSAGAYDVDGFRFRGHQISDGQGRYQFVTRVPGLYPGRTRHFHVKLRSGGAVLTTQLYFPDEPGNRRDGIFDSALVMALSEAAGGRLARFDFVVAG